MQFGCNLVQNIIRYARLRSTNKQYRHTKLLREMESHRLVLLGCIEPDTWDWFQQAFSQFFLPQVAGNPKRKATLPGVWLIVDCNLVFTVFRNTENSRLQYITLTYTGVVSVENIFTGLGFNHCIIQHRKKGSINLSNKLRENLSHVCFIYKEQYILGSGLFW